MPKVTVELAVTMSAYATIQVTVPAKLKGAELDAFIIEKCQQEMHNLDYRPDPDSIDEHRLVRVLGHPDIEPTEL